jgi:hypothetical protein
MVLEKIFLNKLIKTADVISIYGQCNRLPSRTIGIIEDDETDLGAGGIFIVENVDSFYEENKNKLTFVKEPRDIPPGRYTIFKDNSNNVIRIIDLTKNGK